GFSQLRTQRCCGRQCASIRISATSCACASQRPLTQNPPAPASRSFSPRLPTFQSSPPSKPISPTRRRASAGASCGYWGRSREGGPPQEEFGEPREKNGQEAPIT